MKIESMTIYNLKDEKAFNDFRECAERQGVDLGQWLKRVKYDSVPYSGNRFCVRVSDIGDLGSIGYDYISFYERNHTDYKIVVWGHSEKPEIIRLGNLKIVFNGDYTIVTDGRFTGKAKRNSADEYDAVVGLKLAVERYEKNKKDYFKSLTAEEIIKAISGGKAWTK